MPYCFIWSGLVLRGSGNSRWTNGYIESFFKTKKAAGKHRSPAEYVRDTYSFTQGLVVQYRDKYPLEFKKKKRQVEKELEG